MSVLIAVDPGESTGIAVFDGGELVFAITDDVPFFFLENLVNIYMPVADIVCEVWPERGHKSAGQLRIAGILDEPQVAERTSLVKPSSWKGHPRSEPTERDRDMCSDPHQRDAVSIGRWWLATTSRRAPV